MIAGAFRLRPALDGEVGGLDHLAAFERALDGDGVDRLDGGAEEVRRQPAQRRARRQVEGRVEARGARVIGKREHLQLAAGARLDIERVYAAVESDEDVARLAETILSFQRLRDARRNLLRGDGAARPGDDHFGKPAGVDADELMRLGRLDDAVGRDHTPGAEVGRAEDRHVGSRPGILDQIADAHDVPGHGDVGAQRRHRALRRGGGGEGDRERKGESADDEASHRASLSHRINCAVVCSISSAAVMTLEFIS